MAEYTPDPRAYELMILLSPELGDETLDGEIDRISALAEQSGATINSVKSTNPWGRRRLAYPIQKHTDAYYVLYSLASQPGSLDEFERELKLNSRVLRYLLLRQDEVEEETADDEQAVEESDSTEPQDEEAPAEETESSGESGDETADDSSDESDDETAVESSEDSEAEDDEKTA